MACSADAKNTAVNYISTLLFGLKRVIYGHIWSYKVIYGHIREHIKETGVRQRGHKMQHPINQKSYDGTSKSI